MITIDDFTNEPKVEQRIGEFTLHAGNSAEVLKQYPDNHFHSVVTDPPYFIDVFLQDWDSKDNDLTPVFKECLRVLKPGGWIVAFSSSKTYHMTLKMIIDAGFHYEDMLLWRHEMGFPKSQDIGKKVEAYRITGKGNMQAIKQAACIKAGIEYVKDEGSHQRRMQGKPSNQFDTFGTDIKLEHNNEWSGWFTDIKPVMEPIVLAQKPKEGAYYENCIAHGVGALNITEAGSNGKLAGNIFDCPKPSKKERNAGLEGHTDHPTVKPIELMKKLVTLVTPKEGIVLDPFNGSGTTGIAATLLGNDYVGIDMTDKYIDISHKRIEHYIGKK